MTSSASTEVEPTLDLDAIHIEAVAGFDIRTLLALEIGVLNCVDLVRAGRQVPSGFYPVLDAIEFTMLVARVFST